MDHRFCSKNTWGDGQKNLNEASASCSRWDVVGLRVSVAHECGTSEAYRDLDRLNRTARPAESTSYADNLSAQKLENDFVSHRSSTG
jgi:hypothetical protein